MVTFCMYKDFLLFAGASVVYSTFSVTDHKHVLLICCDIFSSMFIIVNNILKFKLEFSSLGIKICMQSL